MSRKGNVTSGKVEITQSLDSFPDELMDSDALMDSDSPMADNETQQENNSVGDRVK